MVESYQPLKGQKALVTGANSGIGMCLYPEFAKAGCVWHLLSLSAKSIPLEGVRQGLLGPAAITPRRPA